MGYRTGLNLPNGGIILLGSVSLAEGGGYPSGLDYPTGWITLVGMGDPSGDAYLIGLEYSMVWSLKRCIRSNYAIWLN